MGISYKDAGVDIEKGDSLVDWLKSDTEKSPHGDKIIDGIGGFASIFQLNFPEIKDPCLVSATDGVGTKLKLAIELNDYRGLGQDLVAMCANDLICTGAQPLFFLDYFATSHLDLEQTKPFLKGLKQACHDVGMALIGGETAEMPGLYQKGDFDCAGFSVGLVDRDQILGAPRVREGDVILGLPSSGFHSNGYSLLRKLLTNRDDEPLKRELLTPTRLYVKPLLEGLKRNKGLHALAHITGGGVENIPRILPENLACDLNFWEWPGIFKDVQKRAKLSSREMLKTFNCGVGMAVIVAASEKSVWTNYFKEWDLESIDMGKVVSRRSEALIYPEPWH